MTIETPTRQPAIFFGHGNPMETLGGRFADAWRALGESLPRPKAILMISAHWETEGTAVTAMAAPRTIHDFGGFPDALQRISYPAPGAPWLAERVAQVLAPTPVTLNQGWGLDHGTWTVLRHLCPLADVPVVQLSLDRTQSAEFHFEVGRSLRVLRDEGVLIAGSGDVVHNLAAARWAGEPEPYDWAKRFNAEVRETIRTGDRRRLINYLAMGEDARLSSPTPEHFLPLLYVLGAAGDGEPAGFITDEITMGSISMLGCVFGA